MIGLTPLLVACGLLATGALALRLCRIRTRGSLEAFALSTTFGLSLTMFALYAPLALFGRVSFTPTFVLHGLGCLGWMVVHRQRP